MVPAGLELEADVDSGDEVVDTAVLLEESEDVDDEEELGTGDKDEDDTNDEATDEDSKLVSGGINVVGPKVVTGVDCSF